MRSTRSTPRCRGNGRADSMARDEQDTLDTTTHAARHDFVSLCSVGIGRNLDGRLRHPHPKSGVP
jgi:hypothetical protein